LGDNLYKADIGVQNGTLVKMHELINNINGRTVDWKSDFDKTLTKTKPVFKFMPRGEHEHIFQITTMDSIMHLMAVGDFFTFYNFRGKSLTYDISMPF